MKNFFNFNDTDTDIILKNYIKEMLYPLYKKQILYSFFYIGGIFISLMLIYGYHIKDLWLIFAFLSLSIIGKIITLKIENIFLQEAIKKLTFGLGLFGACFLSGGVQSPFFMPLIFLGVTFSPYNVIFYNSVLNILGAIWGGVLMVSLFLLEQTNFIPPSPLKNSALYTIIAIIYLVKHMINDMITRQAISFLRDILNEKISQIKEESQTQLRIKETIIELQQTKSVLLAQMSHELKTPLNAIIGFSEMIKMGVKGKFPETYREYIENIHNSGLQLLAIIQKLLDMARLKSGKMNMRLRSFDPYMPLMKVQQEFFEATKRKNIKFHCKDFVLTKGELFSDSNMVTQILTHITDNAIKHCPINGTVTINIRQNGEELIYEIHDTGSGFSPMILKNFGIPFNFDVNPLYENQAGLGLGLSVAKRVTENLGGKIEITNHLNGGAFVKISFAGFRPFSATAVNQ